MKTVTIKEAFSLFKEFITSKEVIEVLEVLEEKQGDKPAFFTKWAISYLNSYIEVLAGELGKQYFQDEETRDKLIIAANKLLTLINKQYPKPSSTEEKLDELSDPLKLTLINLKLDKNEEFVDLLYQAELMIGNMPQIAIDNLKELVEKKELKEVIQAMKDTFYGTVN